MPLLLHAWPAAADLVPTVFLRLARSRPSWIARGMLREASTRSLPDHVLKDIGISRCEVAFGRAACRPRER